MSYFINSRFDTPGQNNHTQIEVNDALSGAAFRYFAGGRQRYAIGVDFGSLFLLHFSRFDLASKRMNWGYFDKAIRENFNLRSPITTVMYQAGRRNCL